MCCNYRINEELHTRAMRKSNINLKDNSRRKFLATSSLLSLRETDRAPFNTDVCALDSGGDALLVQLLAGLGRDSWSSGSSGHEYANTGNDVHRTQERHSAGSIH